MIGQTKATKESEIVRHWHLLNAQEHTLGRLASQAAQLLIGKNKTNYVPYLDCGDWVVVTNAAKIKVTGRKAEQKKYYRHSGYPGGFKEITYAQQAEKDPRRLITHAVSGMLPKNKLRDPRLARLKVFITPNHDYEDKFKAPKKS